MTDDGPPRRRAFVAAALWLVVAFCIWNVRFDWSVRISASQYLKARAEYLDRHGPRVELAPSMDAGVADAVRSATVVAAPSVGIAIGLAIYASRRRIVRGPKR